MNENIILIDWFTFSVRDMSVDSVIGWLGLRDLDWIDRPGHNGYKSAKWYGGMWILFDGQVVETLSGLRDMGICVEFSGQGCRQYETSGNRTLETLVNDVSNFRTANITRLDVAFDDVDKEGNGLLDVMKIERLARKDIYISKFGMRSGEWSCKHSDGGEKNPLAYSVYFGSPRSDVRFRIYDKSQERGGLDYHWVRFELQLRRDAASNFIKSPGTVGYKYTGVINNYLRFITPNKNDSNRRRWASPEWWKKFLSHTEKISVFTKKDVDYNLSRLERYVFSQAGNSLVTYIKCVGWFKFREMLKAVEEEKELNPNQQKLVAEYKQITEGKLEEYRKKNPIDEDKINEFKKRNPRRAESSLDSSQL